jgi:hypothetical protein
MRKHLGHVKGGANKKMVKQPRIIDYLQLNHPKVYEIIDDLAMHGSLNPKRGGAITFLVPSEEYCKEIKKIAESDEPEVATDMISSLILLDLFDSVEAFSKKQDDIPNLLKKRVVIKNIASNKVVIEDGELTLDTGFKPFSRQGLAKRGNMAIWNLKGKVEYEKAPKATMKYLTGAKTGSSQHKFGGVDTNMQQYRELLKDLEAKKIGALRANIMEADGKQACPLFDAVTRVLRVFASEVSYYEEYRRAKCLITMCPTVDYFLLFYNPLIFDPRRVYEAYLKNTDKSFNVDTYRKFCGSYDHAALVSEPCLMFTAEGTAQLVEASKQIRNDMLSRVNKNLGATITNFYSSMDQSNNMGSLGPVYPKCLAELYQVHKHLHQLMDEFSFVMYSNLKKVRSSPLPEERAKLMKEVFSDFHGVYGDLTCPEKKVRFADPKTHEVMLEPKSVYQFVVEFLSTWCFHVTCVLQGEFQNMIVVGAAEDEDENEDSGDESEDPSESIADVNIEVNEQLEQHSNCECVKDAVRIIKNYIKEHGELPPELRDLAQQSS